jgi:hypothetical protein
LQDAFPNFSHELFAEEHLYKRPQDEVFEFVTQIAWHTARVTACTAKGGCTQVLEQGLHDCMVFVVVAFTIYVSLLSSLSL